MIKVRTLLDEFAQAWPELTGIQQRIICEVAENPGVAIGEAADRLDLDLNTTWFNTQTLAEGQRGRRCFGLIRIDKCTDDGRRRLLTLTPLGLKAAKLLAPINVAIDDSLKIKKDLNQLDLLGGKG
jgi:DNA-binding MarR family transcriptional regulator